ncbi:MAG TPA: thiamine pyrophosphate-dependent enzyme [Desulfomonilaceae bacterium]|nr:thiamine pyrophosphate-dependent enzyme [Desulfomonilaceae bacterium]
MSELNVHRVGNSDSSCFEHLLRPGNTNCGGCGMSVALQTFKRAVGDTKVQLVMPACCAAVAAGGFPFTAYGAPLLMSTFASATAFATGMAQVARLNGDNMRVVCWAGDGGTYDIGLASISAAAERNEDILFVCYDNEIYGNTGGQRSSATPAGASTSNTPKGKSEPKKNILGIMAAHRIPYAATVSLAHPDDAVRKMRRAIDSTGFRFLIILSPCPTGWKSEPSMGIELVRLAVRSGLFPVVEVEQGSHWTVNIEPEFSRPALERYISLQRRFQKSGITPDDFTRDIDTQWQELLVRTGSVSLSERLESRQLPVGQI